MEVSKMQQDKIPKIFISYSWSSDNFTLPLAERLVSHGVDVVLDKWDLKEGQDKYAFMEQCVNDPQIDKVLIICDRSYTEKANSRTGGVGDETAIISPEIYGKTKQEKFIPVIVEHNESGEPYIPAYIKSRIYVDLSNENNYENEYEKLLRNIYDKPAIKKPKLGTKPEWLEENRTNLFPLQDIIHQIKGANNPKKQLILVQQFKTQYIDILKTYYEKHLSDGKRVYDIWTELKDVRDYFLDFLDALMLTDCDFGDTICSCFEEFYNTLTCIKSFDENSLSSNTYEFDIYRILMWELFICTITFLIHNEAYSTINSILDNTFFLIDSDFGGKTIPTNYSRFRYYSYLLEDRYKPTTEKRNLFTLMGNILCTEREKKPIYTSNALAQADLFLYQVFNAFNLVNDYTPSGDTSWFPTCYVYARENTNEWEKMRSKRFCKKMFNLFGVSTIDELKQKVSKCTYNNEIRYSNSFDAAPSILNYIKIDEIGIMN